MKRPPLFIRTCALVACVSLAPRILAARILFRDTFEKTGSNITVWKTAAHAGGYVRWSTEDKEDKFASQSHGDKSLVVHSTTKSSYANAYITFENNASEYLIEFYFRINGHANIPLRGFPLCVFENKASRQRTDIALYLHQESLPNAAFNLQVEYSGRTDSLAGTIKETDKWHKVQVYRQRSERRSIVSLYIDGKFVNTYQPLNADRITDKIHFGNSSKDVWSTGEVHYDDVIVSRPPIGKHPRLLLDDASAKNILRPRRYDSRVTAIGVSFEDIWNSLEAEAIAFMNEKYFIINYPCTCTLYYPYPQPPLHEPGKHLWTFASRFIERRLEILSLMYSMTGSMKWANRAKAILLSLCNNWRQWTDPDFPARYVHLDVGQFCTGVSIAYDLLFNTLNNYEKITVQNSLLSLGITPLYLNSLSDTRGKDPIYWPNGYAQMNSSMGLAALSLDDELEELDTARVRIAQMLNEKRVCDRKGGWVEGVLYGTYAMTYTIMFSQADHMTMDKGSLGHPYFQNHALWRLYSVQPGGRNDLNFGDSPGHHQSCEPMFFLASANKDKRLQWYIENAATLRKKRGDFFPLAPFLWLHPSLESAAPDESQLGRYFPDIGWVVLRTGWQKKDYLLALKSSHGRSVEHGFWHCHEDQNQFVFSTDGKWLIGDAGYGITSAKWHNVITLDQQIHQDTFASGQVEDFYICEKYGYTKLDAADCYRELNQYLREAILVMKPTPFAVLLDRIKAKKGVALSTINWRLNTFHNISHNGLDSVNINGSLDVRILSPPRTQINVYDTTIDGNIFHSINVSKSAIDEATYLAALLPSVNDHWVVEKIQGQHLAGIKVNGTLILFSDMVDEKYDLLSNGSYEISTLEPTFNIICNLVPDKSYLVTLKKGQNPNRIYTLHTNHAGIVSFEIPEKGKWHIALSLRNK